MPKLYAFALRSAFSPNNDSNTQIQIANIMDMLEDLEIKVRDTQNCIPKLSIVKELIDQDGNTVGSCLKYGFTVTNTGVLPVYNVIVTDPLGFVEGEPIPVLNPGVSDSKTFILNYIINSSDVKSGQVKNTAIVSSNYSFSSNEVCVSLLSKCKNVTELPIMSYNLSRFSKWFTSNTTFVYIEEIESGEVAIYSTDINCENRMLIAADTGNDLDAESVLVGSNCSSIVYRSNIPQSSTFRLFSVDTISATPLLLSTGNNISNLIISNDSNWVIYAQSTGVLFNIFSSPLDGSTPPIQLSSVGDPVLTSFRPQISNDNTRVVYRLQEGGSLYSLYSRLIDGSDMSPTLISGSSVQPFSFINRFSISSDSKKVVYTNDADIDGSIELFSVDIMGGVITKLNTPTISNATSVFNYKITPDSTRVIFNIDKDINNVFDLYSVPIGGGVNTKLNINPVSIFSYLTSNDSLFVVYRQQNGSLFSVPTSGGSLPELLDTSSSYFQISEDSKFVYSYEGKTGELCKISISDGGSKIVLYNSPSSLELPIIEFDDYLFLSEIDGIDIRLIKIRNDTELQNGFVLCADKISKTDSLPRLSSDGKTILITNIDNGTSSVVIVDTCIELQ